MERRRNLRPSHLQFEHLEPRQVLASGVAASLTSSGLLRIVGSDGDDKILVRQSNDRISISGVDGKWSASKVKSIQVKLFDGDDYLSIHSRATGGKQTLREKVTVYTGVGHDRIRVPGRAEIRVSGEADKILIAPGGKNVDVNGRNLGKISTVLNSAGVLTIADTSADDSIRFKQSGGKIALAGVKGSWNAAAVSSIVVNLSPGNDRVSLDSLANGGTQSLQEKITVNSGAGDELVALANGKDVSFTGAGHVLQVALDGTVTLDGQVLTWTDPPPPPDPDPTPDPEPEPDPNPDPPPTSNWFDSHIQDAALRSLGNQLFQDGLLDRSDMLGLFQSAIDESLIDATEFNDLKSIVSTSSLFGSLEYVWKLSSYVVLGNTANAKYQGQSLGNLVADASSTVLQNLVNKWFLGLDRPAAGTGYSLVSGTLFVDGASYADVDQGALNNCGFMASLAETALRSPQTISSMFIVNGDGTYTVRFYRSAGVAEFVTVDSYLPGGGGVYARVLGGELWAALAEKAYAQVMEMSWFAGGANSYASIEWLFAPTPLAHLTGQTIVGFTATGDSTSLSTFAAAFNDGKLICLTSYGLPSGSPVVGNHVYAVVDFDAAAGSVTLFNPWGIGYGLLTLTWSQVQSYFAFFDRAA